MSIRILLAADFYPPFIGGAELQVQSLARCLSARGHSVSVFSTWHEGLPESEIDNGVVIIRGRGIGAFLAGAFTDPRRRFHPPFADPLLVRRLERMVDELRPNVIHACGWMAYSCAAVARKKRLPLVVSARDYGYFCAVRTFFRDGQVCSGPAWQRCIMCASHVYGPAKGWATAVNVLGGRRSLQKAVVAFHSVSEFVRQTTGAYLQSQDTSVRAPNVVIPSFRTPSRQLNPDFAQEAQLPIEPYILYVGALQRHKGIFTLIEAYRRLMPRPPLVFIGTRWPDTPNVFPLGIHVIENAPQAFVRSAWKNALFGVIPSIWPEPFGNTVHEGMSEGKAVIASRVGGIVDMITSGESGVLVEPGNVDVLTNAMRRLIDDEGSRIRIGQAALERARNFEADVVVPKFEDLYVSIVEGEAAR